MTSYRRAALALALAVTAGTGCGGPESSGREVTVLAAASLTEVFTRIGEQLQASNPDVTVTFSFAGSSALARQITEGAPADVFASAAPEHMQRVVDAGEAAGEPAVFARNELVIAVAAGNPLGVTGLSDLADPAIKVALCAEQVPCGAAARAALAAAGVDLTPVTLEPDVRATLSKVTLGEVDAALVYRTDLAAEGSQVDGVSFPESARAVNDYPIVLLAGASDRGAAESFVDLVRSGQGQAVLSEAGFLPP